MVYSRVEKLSHCVCTSMIVVALILSLVSIAATIAVSFYKHDVYSMSPDLCPRNVVQFNDFLCAGEDFRTNPTPEQPFSVVFGSFSPLSRDLGFHLKLNLTSPVDVNMTYVIYQSGSIEIVSKGTSDDEPGPPHPPPRLEPPPPPSPPGPKPPQPPHAPDWVGWIYVKSISDSWKLLEQKTIIVNNVKNHGPKSKPANIMFYKKDGINENYYKLEVSTLSFDKPDAVASILFEAAPGPKEGGILSVVLICVGMAIGSATFIHISWMLHLSRGGKLSELPFFSKLSIWMALCSLLSFTPLSLMQYFDDTFEYIIANSALEQLSIVGAVVLLSLMCRHLLLSVPHESVQVVKLLQFFRGKTPVIITSVFATVGSACITLCHIDPALGKFYTISSYVFAAFAAATYLVVLIVMFLTVDCMRRARLFIDSKRMYYLSASCVVWEALILISSIVYVIWHPGTLQAYDVVHFNHLIICTLLAEFMCPMSDIKKSKVTDDAQDLFSNTQSLYDDVMTMSDDN